VNELLTFIVECLSIVGLWFLTIRCAIYKQTGKSAKKQQDDTDPHDEITTKEQAERLEHAALRSMESNTHDADSEQKKKTARRQRKEAREWSTSIGIAVYTVLTAVILWSGLNGNSINWDSLRYSNRASVVLSDVDFETIPEGIAMVPRWENTGNTPTVNMETFMVALFSKEQPTEGFSNIPLPGTADADADAISLGAKGTSGAIASILPGNCLREAATGMRGFTYIWGRATYRDVFSDETHITRFCWRVISFDLSNPFKIHVQHYQCKEGNCIDSECPKRVSAPLLPRDFCQPLPRPAASPHDTLPGP